MTVLTTHTVLSGYEGPGGPRLLIGIRSPADVLRLRGTFTALAIGEATVVRLHDERGVAALHGVACRCVASETASVVTVEPDGRWGFTWSGTPDDWGDRSAKLDGFLAGHQYFEEDGFTIEITLDPGVWQRLIVAIPVPASGQPDRDEQPGFDW
jgi:hypothetical protein